MIMLSVTYVFRLTAMAGNWQLTNDSPDCLPILLLHFLVFSLHFLVVGFVR